MPRKRKRKNKEARSRAAQQDKLKADFWSDRIQAGKKVKMAYEDTAEQVMAYFKAQHSKLYDDQEITNSFSNFAGAAKISIPKIAQMKNSLGPRLYLAKPDRKIRPRTDDGVMLGLSRLTQAYLNYTVRESKHPKQLRKSTDDSVLRGRGFQRQIWDDIREIITSVYLSSCDVVFDPDFNDIESAQWVAIRHTEPLWQTKRRVTEKWRVKDLDEHCIRSEDDEKPEQSAPILVYWEVLSKMGAGFRGMDLDDSAGYPDEEDFVRLEIVEGHDAPIAEGEWDVPLYLDRDWPLSHYDPVETPDSPWPESMAGQVLSCQKGIDLLSSLRLSSCKNRDRVVVFCDSKVAPSNQSTLRNGSAADFISVDVPTGHTLASLIQVADFGQGSVESARERAYLEEEIETATGVTSMVSGADDSGSKDRSATATRARSSASSARLEDLKQKVREFETDAARKEALMMRLMLDAEDIEPYVRVSDIDLYYVKVEVPGGAAIPVRSFEKDTLSLKDIYPSCSNYFSSPEEAADHCMQLWGHMLQSKDPRVQQIASSIDAFSKAQVAAGEQPLDPNLPLGISVDVVTVQRIWLDTAGMSPEELMREMSYEIAAGAGVEWDRQTEMESVDMLLQTLLPIVLQNQDYEGANGLLKLHYEAHDFPEDERVTLKPPPMPQPAPGQEPPPNGKK